MQSCTAISRTDWWPAGHLEEQPPVDNHHPPKSSYSVGSRACRDRGPVGEAYARGS
ncbi:MAG: hypothetical protein J07HR59_01795, partial [Halorubrum sp. J07HR59]